MDSSGILLGNQKIMKNKSNLFADYNECMWISINTRKSENQEIYDHSI